MALMLASDFKIGVIGIVLPQRGHECTVVSVRCGCGWIRPRVFGTGVGTALKGFFTVRALERGRVLATDDTRHGGGEWASGRAMRRMKDEG